MEESKAPYMVEQVIKFSDGTETVISYNELGEKVAKEVEEVVESPVEEVIAEEIVEEEVAEEVAPESSKILKRFNIFCR